MGSSASASRPRCGGAASALYRGGRVTAVAGIATQPLVYYMGATGGGVWKTDDAGVTWRNVSDGFFKHRFGRRGLRRGIERGCRLRRDGRSVPARKPLVGRRRLQVDRRRQDVDARRARPTAARSGGSASTPRTLMSCMSRRSAIPTDRTRSAACSARRTAATTWQRVLFVDDKTGAADIAMDPSNPQVLYATTWEVLRTPWGITSTGPGSGLYKSTDGGDTWTGSPPACRHPTLARSASRSRRSIRSASGRPSKPTTRAASIARTTAGAPGSC